jgi:hypothetical protein
MATEEKKCGHFPCACRVPDDAAYCSDACRRIAEGPVPDTEASFSRCPCDHPCCRK